MKHVQEITYSLETIDIAVDTLYNLMQECSVFTFTGDLGAGKTTLIKKLLQRCGIQEIVTSPTFTYVNIYTNSVSQVFYHFDLYRMKSVYDFINAGFNEYLYQTNSWSLIEWPDVVEPLLTNSVCKVTISYISANERILKITI